MIYLKTFESFSGDMKHFNKEELKEMAKQVFNLVEDDERVSESLIWGSYFEKENPKDIDIIIEINVEVGEFDDKIKELSNLQEKFITTDSDGINQYPLDLTIINPHGEAFLLFATSTKNIEESPDRTEDYNNLTEGRPVKRMVDIFK